jgi:hypothetical protein
MKFFEQSLILFIGYKLVDTAALLELLYHF